MSTHRTTLESGEVWNLPSGASFQILETDKPVDVEFIYNGQRRSSAKEVERTYYYRPYVDLLDDSGQAFQNVRITAAYGGCEIVVDISDASSGTNSLTGVVEVVNSDRVRTDDEKAYLISTKQTGVAGEYGFALLENPVGSGVVIYVNKIIITAVNQIDGIIGVSGDIDATKADPAVNSVSSSGDTGSPAWNKKVGGAASKARAVALRATSGSLDSYRGNLRLYVDAFSNYVAEFTEPMRIDEGCAVGVQSLTVGETVSGGWEFFEVQK